MKTNHKIILVMVALMSLGVAYNAIFMKRVTATSQWGINSKSSLGESGHDAVLDDAHIIWLREDINPSAPDWPERRAKLEAWRKAGKRILGIVPYSLSLSTDNATDLRKVYDAAVELEKTAGGVVDAWENMNEPDLGFTRDLPDRSVAFMKAVYLGLKDASEGKKPVLLPALGLPPGKWFQRAAYNGLLFYGDAFNLHYYSHARDFDEAVNFSLTRMEEAKFAELLPKSLPVWVTEIGLNCVPLDQPDDETSRSWQADFLKRTSEVASKMQLAGFMPYALTDAQVGYALEKAPGQPYPALETYLKITQKLALKPPTPWINAESTASRVILQWMPDSETVIPHKVSGTYRFREDAGPIQGELRIYTFSKSAVSGRIKIQSDGDVTSPEVGAGQDFPIELTPNTTQVKHLTFLPKAGYHRGQVMVKYTGPDPRQSPSSLLAFGIETAPQDRDFVVLPCEAENKSAIRFQYIDEPQPYDVTSRAGAWIGLNGLKMTDLSDGAALLAQSFSLDNPSLKPGEPPMAIARVPGFPVGARFLRLASDRAWDKRVKVRVDLVDDAGQRFSVFENGGVSYDVPANEVWLSVADFHPYFWGRFRLDKPFKFEDVREIQLRFYFERLRDPVQVRLDVMGPQGGLKPKSSD